MSKKIQLTKEELQAIHALTDKELEKLHKQTGDALNKKAKEAANIIRMADQSNDMITKIQVAVKIFQTIKEEEEWLSAINLESLKELNQRNKSRA